MKQVTFFEQFFGVKIVRRRSGILRRRRIVRRRRVTKQSAQRRADFLARKDAAFALVTERLAHFNTGYGFEYKKIFIRNQVTRWGSCSSRGNLSFNYAIVLLPPHLADYIIVHELCHLGEFNHSAKFWELVAQADPDYLAHRAELRKVRIHNLYTIDTVQ